MKKNMSVRNRCASFQYIRTHYEIWKKTQRRKVWTPFQFPLIRCFSNQCALQRADYKGVKLSDFDSSNTLAGWQQQSKAGQSYRLFSNSFLNKLLLLTVVDKRLFHTSNFLKNKGTNVEDESDINIEENQVFNSGSSEGEGLKNDPELKKILEDIRKDFSEKETISDINEGDTKEVLTKNNDDFSYYEVAEDIEEYEYFDENDILSQENPHVKNLPIGLERGQTGVFDLDELVFLLQELGCNDVVDFPIPPEYNFCNNMVIASAKSMRHMRALHEEIYWIYKQKKGPDDPFIKISGTNDTFWCAMDMGNIVVHLFYGDAREYYDIESLWTKRPEDGQQPEEVSKYELSPEDLFWIETQGDKRKSSQKEKDKS